MGLQELAVGHVRRDGAALREAALSDLDAAVPTCPGWAMHDLLEHMGWVHHWAAGILGGRTQERTPLADHPRGPADPAQRVEYFDEGLVQVTEAMASTSEDTPVWNWADRGPAPARFWLRRMPLETAVHRWDAQAAVHAEQPVDTGLAVIGLEEMAEVWLPRLGRPLTQVSTGASIHLHCTDADSEWMIRLGPEGATVTREHAKGDVAVRGTASDLYLLLWNRVSAEQRCQVFGDASLLRRFAELVRI